jgi:hypothetical protein
LSILKTRHRGVEKSLCNSSFLLNGAWEKIANTKHVALGETNLEKLSSFVCFESWAQGCPGNLYNCPFLPNGMS